MNASDGAEQQNGMPSLCAAGCGFFSNIGTNGYCSKCHRDIVKAELESAKAQTSLAQALSSPQPQQQQQQQRHASPEAQPALSSSSALPASAAGPTASPSPQPSSAAAAPACSSPAAAASAAGAAAEAQQQQQEAQPSTSNPTASATPPAKPPSPTRCLVCNKKVGLTGFSCKCCPEAVFCSAHRIAEDHACTFDWKGVQRQQLAEKNPVVAGAKVEKL